MEIQDVNESMVKLKCALDDAEHMAFQLMRSNSDTGQTLQFIKLSFHATSFEQLAHLLIDHLANEGFQSSLLIQGIEGEYFFTLNPADEMLDRGYMMKYINGSRIVENKNRVIINYPNCSLLINNMPEEEARRGELRDNLSILLDGVNEKVNTIILATRAQEVRNVKDAFFSLMSHELKTPLNPIVGFTSHLKKNLHKHLQDADKKAFEAIEDNCTRLLSAINDLLSLARVKNGEITVHQENIKIETVVRDAIACLRQLIDKYDVSVSFKEHSEQLCYVDPARMLDVLVGILSNAIKYSPGGQVQVSLSGTHEKDECFAEIAIKDNGRGIDPDNFEKIFHHFSERDTPTTQKTRSNGICLFLAKEVVRLNGGRIEVSSVVGEGSEFKVVLPAINDPEHQDIH